MEIIRRVYDWVLHWAETPYGVWALFILAFAESSFFPFPPDVLLIALVMGVIPTTPGNYPPPPHGSETNNFLQGLREWRQYLGRLMSWVLTHWVQINKTFLWSRPFYLAFICSVGSVIGGIFGYGIGHYLWYGDGNTFSTLARFFFNIVPGFAEESFYRMKECYDKWNFWIVFTAGFTPFPYKLITITAGVFKINFPIFCFASLVSRSARFFLVAGLLWAFGPPIKIFIDQYFNFLCFLFMALLISGFLVIKLLV